MKITLQILFIGILTLSCNPKIKNELRIADELEIIKYNEEVDMKKMQYLETNVFYGLENLNDGFDSETIFYFSESDFETILKRVQKLGIGIMGIEPWLNGEFYDVKVAEDYSTISTDPNWYQKAFSEFKLTQKNLQYAATYEIPKKLLEE